ncbi:hypothetical protein BZG30_31610, partial [Escherichia coli]|nr:hypothetical protein [Escherichia coli]
SNANLGDLNILDNVYVFEESDFSHSSFENNFIGFREYITHITYPVSLKNTVFDILRLKNNEYFFKEKDYYNRLSLDSLKIPENVMISTNSGYVKGYSND